MTSDDEFVDIALRPAAEVARRCLALSALLQRVALFADGEVHADDDREAAAFDLREWPRAENLWDALTSAEAAFLTEPVGNAIPDAFDSMYFGESLAALAWTLDLLPSLEPHMAPDYAKLIDTIPAPWDPTASWLTSQQLRPESEIAIERERAEVWEWRGAIELARRGARVGDIGQIESAIFDITYEVEETGLLGPENVRGDYELWHAIGDLEDEAITSSRMLFEHRLRALNWVCGFGDSWDDVPLEI